MPSPTFAEGLEACRRILHRGATPAVLRLYDAVESARNFDLEHQCALVVLDEADPGLLAATLAVVEEECASTGASRLDDGLVQRWVEHKNDVSALAPLYRAGIVVDTIEIAARWAALVPIYEAATAALTGVDGTLAASAHQSHAYPDGACLYFTFAGRMADARANGGAPETDTAAADAWAERYYVAAWTAVMEVVRARGGAISHHHGIGVNRGRFVEDALGAAFAVLVDVKNTLDPRGILNPGKLGLPSPFGEARWP